MFEKLSKWQQIQSRKIVSNTKNEAFQVASLSSYFNRICRLDSSRDRLTSSLFLNVSLRSVQDRSALQNMITLCEDNSRVVYRSSLRSKNDHCSVFQCAREMNWFIYFFFLVFQILDCYRLANSTFFDFTASVLSIDENIFIVATRTILKIDTTLSSCAFSATNESSVRSNDLSTVNVISSISRRSQFNAIHSSFVELSLLLSNVSSISSI